VRLARIALLLNGVLFAGYGLLCLVMPETLTGAAGLGLTNTVASIEVRAMYGGLELALGVLFLLAASRPTLLEAGLIAGVTIFSGLGLARLLGIALDGGPGTYNVVAVLYELTAAAVMLVALGRVGSALAE
jgi:hypothetical protein